MIGPIGLDYDTLAIADADQQLIVYTAPAGSAAQASLEMLSAISANP